MFTAGAKVTFVPSNKYLGHDVIVSQQYRSMKSIAARYYTFDNTAVKAGINATVSFISLDQRHRGIIYP